jgi:hypothetical protein
VVTIGVGCPWEVDPEVEVEVLDDGAHFEVIPDTQHLVNLERPDHFTQLVLELLARLCSERRDMTEQPRRAVQ